jgi:hypothetical protein
MEQGLVLVGQGVKGHLVQRKKWIKKFIKSYWCATPNTLAKLMNRNRPKWFLFDQSRKFLQIFSFGLRFLHLFKNPHKLSQNKTIPNKHLLLKPKGIPCFFPSQNLMQWTKWEFISYNPKTQPNPQKCKNIHDMQDKM